MLELVLKDPRPSIECRNQHTLKNLNFLVLLILFLIDCRKYSNSLRYWILTFMSYNHHMFVFFLCFPLHVMYLEYMKVSLFEKFPSKKKKRFHNILIFLDAPV